MKRTLLVTGFCVMFFAGFTAFAGVEPSPFKSFIADKIEMIKERILPLADNATGGAPSEVAELAEQIYQFLDDVNTDQIKHQLVVTQSIMIMERITAVMFDPQPEPPGYQLSALNALQRLSHVAFDPQPEPPGHLLKSLGLLDRISEVGFDPQPEPPGYEKLQASMEAISRISAIAFDPQPEPPGKSLARV